MRRVRKWACLWSHYKNWPWSEGYYIMLLYACAHLLLQEIQNYNSLLNNHRQKDVLFLCSSFGRMFWMFYGGMDPTIKDTPRPRAKKKPQQDGRKGKITFRVKPHTCQRCSEGSNKTFCTPGPRDPTETEPDLSSSVWVSPVEVWVSSGLPQGQGLWVQETWSHSLWHKPYWRRSPLTPPYSRWADDSQTAEQLHQRNSRTIKKVLGPTQVSQPGDPERDWEAPGNLTLEANGIWLQNLHRTQK